MMSEVSAQVAFFLTLGVALVSLGLFGLYRLHDPIRRLIAVNLMGSGTFLAMVALARRQDPPDAILQGLVVTGLVVAVCATAFALRLITESGNIAKAPRREPD
jgi:multicomponent Na+:H+ antiporter subunit C